MANNLTTKVTGIDEVVRELRRYDKKASFKARNRVKKYTKFAKTRYESEWRGFDFPSGFYHNGRTGVGKEGNRAAKVDVKLGGRLRTSSDSTGKTRERPLLSIVLKSAPHAIADMAGTGQLSQALGGRPSRVQWPVAEDIKDDVIRAVKWAYEKTAREVNVKFRWDGY